MCSLRLNFNGAITLRDPRTSPPLSLRSEINTHTRTNSRAIIAFHREERVSAASRRWSADRGRVQHEGAPPVLKAPQKMQLGLKPPNNTITLINEGSVMNLFLNRKLTPKCTSGRPAIGCQINESAVNGYRSPCTVQGKRGWIIKRPSTLAGYPCYKLFIIYYYSSELIW